MDIFKDIPGISGWPGTLFTLFGIIVYGWYVTKSSKGKAEKIANDAKNDAIEAMDAHLNVLKDRVKDAEEENIKMKHTMETIISALKTRGIYITIDGDMVHISEGRNSTSTHIHGSKHEDET